MTSPDHKDEGALDPRTSAVVDPGGEMMAAALPVDETLILSADGEPLLPPGTLVDRYILLEPLGAGGLSVVYAAYDPQLHRRIALKFLHHDALGARDHASSQRARLLREARAIARVSDPHVVAVYDVGTYRDEIYIAEELVEGQDLACWLDARRRTPAAVLEVFRQAGKGLAAAHAAGIVHRDFKPANVLVGEDGRVRVADFGLARATGDLEGQGVTPPAALALSITARTSDPLDTPLTRAGEVLGTPRYMSPEQHQGQPADARSDQFSFCVALYEALYGELPFPEQTRSALMAAMRAGKVREAPPGSRVPVWLRRVLARGLAFSPEERYPSMNALIDALGQDPQRRRRWSLVLGLSLAAAVAVGFAGYRLYEQRLVRCRGAEHRLAGIWDEGRKASIRAAFLKTGLPFAEDAWRHVATLGDAFAARWVEMHTEACEATWHHGEQSHEMLDLRMQCLGQHLAELRSTGEFFGRADAQIVERAAAVVEALSPVSECADLRALAARVPPPRDPATRAQVERVRARIAEARTHDLAWKHAEGLPIAEVALTEARKTGYGPVVAEALLVLGLLQDRAGRNDAAEQSLEEAAFQARAVGDDETAAHAESQLVVIVGFKAGRSAEGHRWGRAAAASLARLGHPPELEGMLANTLGVLYGQEGKRAEAEAEYRRALALRVAALGPEHRDVAGTRNNLGMTLEGRGQYAEAEVEFRRALEVWEKTLGRFHPDLAFGHNNLGNLYTSQGKYAEAELHYASALELRLRALGPMHPAVARVRTNLAGVLEREERYPAAVAEAERALVVFEKALGRESFPVAATLVVEGDALRGTGQLAAAEAAYRRSLGIHEKLFGPEHPELVGVLVALCRLERQRGQLGPAQRYGERALAIAEAKIGKEERETGETLLALAEVYLLAGPQLAARAVALLEQAVTIAGRAGVPGEWRARCEFALARALWAEGTNRGRARELGERARATLRSMVWGKTTLAEVETWLAEHRV